MNDLVHEHAADEYERERERCVQRLIEINRQKYLSRKPKVKSPKKVTQTKEFAFSVPQSPRPRQDAQLSPSYYHVHYDVTSSEPGRGFRMQQNQLDQSVAKLKRTLQSEIAAKQQALRGCQRVDRAKTQVLQIQIKRLQAQESAISDSPRTRTLSRV